MEKKKVLIIDDEQMLCHFLKLNLEDTEKYNVETRSKGYEALAAAKSFQPDVIILDMILQDCDGADVEKTLKEEPTTKDIPIIFFTAIATKDETKDNENIIGGRFIIAKPVTLDKLIEGIERVTIK